MRRYLLISLLCSAILLLFGGWGATAHRMVNGAAPAHLPPAMAGFLDRTTILQNLASAADTRKSSDPTEASKHYIDIDDYPDYAAGTLPHALDSLIARYGATRVQSNGLLPWATVAAMDSLTARMRRGEWSLVWSTAADLGHYVADAHEPLHCTVNYDGQLTGNRGIHSRHESGMIDRYQQLITFSSSGVTMVDQPLDFVFDYIDESYQYVDSILAADTNAKLSSGWDGSGTAPSAYYTALWQLTGGYTRMLLQHAAERYARLLYTAWVNAGEPIVPLVTGVQPVAAPSVFRLEPAFPNPFNPSTTIRYQLAVRSRVIVAVYSLTGTEVARLVEGMVDPGVYDVRWTPEGSAGVYFCRIEAIPGDGGQRSYSDVRKIVYLK